MFARLLTLSPEAAGERERSAPSRVCIAVTKAVSLYPPVALSLHVLDMKVEASEAVEDDRERFWELRVARELTEPASPALLDFGWWTTGVPYLEPQAMLSGSIGSVD